MDVNNNFTAIVLDITSQMSEYVMKRFKNARAFIGNSFPVGQLWNMEVATAVFVYRIFEESKADIAIRIIDGNHRRIEYVIQNLLADFFASREDTKVTKKTGIASLEVSVGGECFRIEFVGSMQDAMSRMPYSTIIYCAMGKVPRPIDVDEFTKAKDPRSEISEESKKHNGVYLIEYIRIPHVCPTLVPFDNDSPISFYELKSDYPPIIDDPFVEKKKNTMKSVFDDDFKDIKKIKHEETLK